MAAKFWIVWSPTGTTPPRNKHPSHGAALWVATQMAVKHPGQEFYVMSAKAVCQSDKPKAHVLYIR
jgi:hypothetical protein